MCLTLKQKRKTLKGEWRTAWGWGREPTVMIMYERKHSGVCANLKN